MSEILDLAQRGELSLALPFSVKAELEHPNTPPEIKRAASGMIHTLRVELTPNELAIRSKLLILFKKMPNQASITAMSFISSKPRNMEAAISLQRTVAC